MHKYVCAYRYGNKYCYQLCLSCKGFLTNHIKKPIEPKKESCCGDACPNYVWNMYFKEKENYDNKIKETLNNIFENAKKREDKLWRETNLTNVTKFISSD